MGFRFCLKLCMIFFLCFIFLHFTHITHYRKFRYFGHFRYFDSIIVHTRSVWNHFSDHLFLTRMLTSIVSHNIRFLHNILVCLGEQEALVIIFLLVFFVLMGCSHRGFFVLHSDWLVNCVLEVGLITSHKELYNSNKKSNIILTILFLFLYFMDLVK